MPVAGGDPDSIILSRRRSQVSVNKSAANLFAAPGLVQGDITIEIKSGAQIGATIGASVLLAASVFAF